MDGLIQQQQKQQFLQNRDSKKTLNACCSAIAFLLRLYPLHNENRRGGREVNPGYSFGHATLLCPARAGSKSSHLGCLSLARFFFLLFLLIHSPTIIPGDRTRLLCLSPPLSLSLSLSLFRLSSCRLTLSCSPFFMYHSPNGEPRPHILHLLFNCTLLG